MTTRALATLAAVILVIVLGIGALYGFRAFTPPVTTVGSSALSPTPSVAISAANSSPESPAPGSGASVSGTTYASSTYQYSVVLPQPFRHSDHLSLEGLAGRPALQDVFTARTPADETANESSSQTASPTWNYVVVVHVFTGVGSDTPRAFYTTFGGAVGESIVDATVDGRQAVKVTNGTYPLLYVIKDGSRMFQVGYRTYDFFSVPTGATTEKLVAILDSFHFAP